MRRSAVCSAMLLIVLVLASFATPSALPVGAEPGAAAPAPAATEIDEPAPQGDVAPQAINFVQIAAGDNHTCGLTNTGLVYCWGWNEYGQLGDGTTTIRRTPVAVSGLSGAVALAAGWGHTCALLRDGTARCWGWNDYGQLGDGTTDDRPTPVAVSGLSGAVALAAGGRHTCALLRDGAARCWGINWAGQLGDGTTDDRRTPVAVSGLSGAGAITAGRWHTCALLRDGTARCWGWNGYGQLGDSTMTTRRTPVAVSGLSGAVALAAGGWHTCALLRDGTARCWGDNEYGQLGDGTTDGHLMPVAVSGLSGAVALAAGRRHTCVLLGDGAARCWGMNSGQLGDGTTTDRWTPVAVSGLSGANTIAAGGSHTCALLSDGSARCWGSNWEGQLGNGTPIERRTPVAVSGLSSANTIAAGWGHTCALLGDGSARCWGINGMGQLGDGTTISRLTPVAVSGLNSAVALAAGELHTCALLRDGTARCWGDNRSGQLGDGTTSERLTPVAVSGLSGVVALTAGDDHTCALLSNGAARCWGWNSYGQLGDGTTISRLTPVAVIGLSGAVALAAGGRHTCALLRDGTARCWGNNWAGQLGDGTTTNRLTPVTVSRLSSAAALAAGGGHTCALLRDSTARCWGSNGSGRLGDGTTSDRLTPVAVSGLSGAVALAAGDHHTCARLSDGTARCWGDNDYGQLGDSTITDRWTPVAVSGLSGAVALTAGYQHTCTLLRDGTARCWGFNLYGQLGDGTAGYSPVPVTVTGSGGGSSLSLTVAPSSIAANGVAAATVTISGVRAGQQVRVGMIPGSVGVVKDPVGVADASGRFVTTITSRVPGSAILFAQDPRTYQSLSASQQVTFTAATGPMPGHRPVEIVSVRSTHPLNAAYLEGIPVPNIITVEVDWKGSTPGQIDYRVNGHLMSLSMTSTTASFTINMGAGLRQGHNTLEIVAVNATGQRSTTQSFAPFVWPMPLWMAGLLTSGLASPPMLSSGTFSGAAQYRIAFRYPPYEFKLGAPGFGGPDGNLELGLAFNGELGLPIGCLAPIEGKVAGGADAKFNFFNLRVKPRIYGQLEAQPIGLCVWDLPRGTTGFDIDVEATLWRKPVLVMVAYLNPTVGLFFEQTIIGLGLGKYIGSGFGETYLDGKINISGSVTTQFLNSTPFVTLSDPNVGGRLGIEGGYRREASATEVKLWIGGDGGLFWSRSGPLLAPTGPFSFDRAELRGEVGGSIRAAWFELGATGEIVWTYPSASLALLQTVPEPVWRVIPARVPRSRDQHAITALQAATAALPPNSVIVATDVYTYAETTLAANPTRDDALLIWVEPDPLKALGRAHELWFSRWNGTAWSAPAAVTNDDRLDGAPQATWAGDSRVVIVWQRLNATLPPDATWNAATANQIEIATATFDPATGQWSPVALLTNNSAMDFAPQITAGADGRLLAIWRRNSAGLLNGNATNRDQIIAAFYNAGWNTPSAAIADIPGLADYAAGMGNGTAAIAFTAPVTATGATSPTLQLFTATWNGSAWSAAVQHTNDTLNHRAPQVVYNAANQPIVVWLAGGQLRSRNLNTGAEASLILPAGIGSIDRIRALRDSAGNIAVTLTAQAEQRDLYLSVYDNAYAVWGRPRQLTDDSASEIYLAPAFDYAGRLRIGFAATQMGSEVRNTTPPGATQPLTYTVPVELQTDLLVITHQIERNLTLAQGSLSVSESRPAPGQVVQLSAVVSNTGDLALNNVTVAFYDGDPGSGGIALGSQTLVGPLSAGMTATLTISYTVPAEGGVRTIVAIADPQAVIAESNENDNRASLAAFGPDLQLVSVGVEYWPGNQAGLIAVVRNGGTANSPATDIRYTRETPEGPLLVSDAVPALSAGETVTITTVLDTNGLTPGQHLIVGTVNQQTFVEVWRENNRASLTINQLPDIMVSPLAIWLEPQDASTTQIRALVYNLSPVAAQNVRVGVYRRWTLDSAALIFERVIPALPAEGYVEISGTTSAPLGCGVYVFVDPDAQIAERSRVNNLAKVEGTGFCATNEVFLPVVTR